MVRSYPRPSWPIAPLHVICVTWPRPPGLTLFEAALGYWGSERSLRRSGPPSGISVLFFGGPI